MFVEIPRSATVRLFNIFTVGLLLGHIAGILYPSLAASIVIDSSVGILGVICFLNMRFDKFKYIGLKSLPVSILFLF